MLQPTRPNNGPRFRVGLSKLRQSKVPVISDPEERKIEIIQL